MKSFVEFLIEMSLDDAMKLFGIKEIPSNKEELNKHFKKLALKHHPDLGGSEETMKLLNQAKELLDKNLGKKGSSSYVSPEEYRKAKATKQAEKDKQYEVVDKLILKEFAKFDEKLYKEYLDKAFGISFTAKKEVKILKDYWYSYRKLIMEFADEGRDKVFELSFMVNEEDLRREMFDKNSGLTSTNNTLNIGITSFVYLDGKKQVLVKERFIKSSDVKIFTDPTILLPKTKIAKLAKGEPRKNSKVAKRDFEAMFKAKFDATMESSGAQRWYFIPVNEYVVVLYRTTGLGTQYHLARVGKKPVTKYHRYEDFIGASELTKYGFLSVFETQEGFDFLKNALTEFNKTGDYKKFIKSYGDFGNSLLKSYS